jgi:hypothetical protein
MNAQPEVTRYLGGGAGMTCAESDAASAAIAGASRATGWR